jgi:hypothetical protein
VVEKMRRTTAAAETPHSECYLSLSEAAAFLMSWVGLIRCRSELNGEREACCGSEVS